MSSNNAYMRKYMLERYHRRMAEARAFLGGKCVHCGATDNLEMDHIDRRTKLFTIGKSASASEARFWAEVRKCQLLCGGGRCHLAKGRDAGDTRAESAHGTINRYLKYGCRCGACRATHSEANRRYHAKSRAKTKHSSVA